MAKLAKLIGLALLRMAVLSLLTLVVLVSLGLSTYAYDSGRTWPSMVSFFLCLAAGGLVGAILACPDWIGGRANEEKASNTALPTL